MCEHRSVTLIGARDLSAVNIGALEFADTFIHIATNTSTNRSIEVTLRSHLHGYICMYVYIWIRNVYN